MIIAELTEGNVRYFGLENASTPAISNQLLTKETNAKLLFNIVSKEGSISRAQLAKVAGLSPSTVSVLTEELIRNHILLEAGAGQSAPTGRKPIMLEVDPNGLQIPCFAFRPSGLLYVLYDLKFNIIERRLLPYGPELSRQKQSYITPSNEVILNLLVTALEESEHLDMQKVRIITISFYGTFLRDTSMFASSVLSWHLSSTFIDSLRAKFNNVPLLVGNNSNLMAYAEKALCHTDRENLLYIHLDEGVGSGIILDNHLVVGECGISGEIGYMLIDGKRLESIASKKAILDTMKERTGITTLEEVGHALSLGDNFVTDAMRDIAAQVATAINNTLCMFGSMEVYLGGEVMALGPVFLDLLRASMQEFGFRRVLPHSPIAQSRLPDHGDCLGAARAYVGEKFTVILP